MDAGGDQHNGRARPTGSPYPEPLERLITEFSRLPGVGRRSAERLTFHLLKEPAPEALKLARAVEDVKKNVGHCSICLNLTEETPCAICADERRERSLVMVIEQPRDLLAIEQTSMHRGLYHVLMGRISPLEGIGPDDLAVAELLRRVDDPDANAGAVKVDEVVLALNPTLEGDGTALYLAQAMKARGVRVTRLARGLPTGSQLEFANKAVLADAILGRLAMD